MRTCYPADITDLVQVMSESAYLELGALTTAVPAVRTWSRVVLGGWDLSPLADDAELILSELVTNAVIHASALKMGVCLLSDRERLVIMVSDSCPRMPVRADEEREPDAMSGRGLVIVEALAQSWGAYWLPRQGKVVWALLDP
jgi:anti-sigma regulatory factor (Ser/Thr protein kinase)